MAIDLTIRAGLRDESLVENLLVQRGSPFHQPSMSRLVVDAATTLESDAFRNAAQSAGIPFIVDPQTVLLQGPVRDGDRWLKLPYAQAAPLDAVAFASDVLALDRLVEQVVVTQIQAQATVIVPPYFVVDHPDDPTLAIAVEAVRRTAEFCSRNSINLKLLPTLVAQIKTFGPENTWEVGIDRFADAVSDFDVESVAACLGPAGDGKDSVAKVTNVFNTMIRLQVRSGHPVTAWRQGVLGPALVAAGLSGYECGPGIGEQSQPTKMKNAHAKKGGGPGGIYLDPLGRSVPYTAARILLGDMAIRPKVMCDVESCCSGVGATLDNPKLHAVRSRARQLDRLAAQPERRWRLNDIAKSASAAKTLAVQANKILTREYATHNIERGAKVHPGTFESLAVVCSAIGGQEQAASQ